MSEQIYDTEIAPKLLELARICEEHGMGFVAMCEFAPGETGRTEAPMPVNASAGLLITTYAARCHNNADLLIQAIIDLAKERGHTSLFLSQLGVPMLRFQLPANAPITAAIPSTANIPPTVANPPSE